MTTLSLENCTHLYKGMSIPALDEVSVNFSDGIYGILGGNGAGKSTLFKILSNTLNPTSGRLLYNGQVVEPTDDQYRSVIGYMPQQQALYPDLSVDYFLRYMSVLKGIPPREAEGIIQQVLEATDLVQKRNQRMGALSGGMKQRVLIAQALLNDPKILILDEPTAGLDPFQRTILRNWLTTLSQDRIILISTHVVSDIEHISKEILFLKQGNLLLQGSVPDILTKYEGKVYEAKIPADLVPDFRKDYLVSRLQSQPDGQVLIRICGERPDQARIQGTEIQFNPVTPTVEDVYLFLYGGEGDVVLKGGEDCASIGLSGMD